MWLYTRIGFFSIVHKDEPGTLTVRSRLRRDIEDFKAASASLKEAEIIVSEDSDYRYRLIADRAAVMDAIDEIVADIDYDNFKEEVEYTDKLRVPVYSALWGITMRLEELEGD